MGLNLINSGLDSRMLCEIDQFFFFEVWNSDGFECAFINGFFEYAPYFKDASEIIPRVMNEVQVDVICIKFLETALDAIANGFFSFIMFNSSWNLGGDEEFASL